MHCAGFACHGACGDEQGRQLQQFSAWLHSGYRIAVCGFQWGAEDNAGREEAAYEYGDEKNAFLQGNAQITADSDMNGADAAGGAQMEAAAAEEPESEPYRFHATVEILGTDLRMDSGVLYTAKVITSDNPAMEADSEIRIFCSAVSSEGVTMLEDSQTYDLVLCEDRSGEAGQEVTYLLVGE